MPLLLVGSLEAIDLSPSGYRCARDEDCAGGLVCAGARCVSRGSAPDGGLSDGGVTGPVRGLLRLHGPGGNELLVFDSAESADLLSRGYQSDGVVLRGSTLADPAFVPLYRLYNPSTGDYLLTPYASERDGAVAHYGYQDSVIAFYDYPVGKTQGLPLYRLLRNSLRHYVVGDAARDQAVDAGYTFEMPLCRGEPP